MARQMLGNVTYEVGVVSKRPGNILRDTGGSARKVSRSRRLAPRRCLAPVALACLLISPISAIAAEQAEPGSPLGVRQQRVRRMMQDLDRKFQSLAEKLQATEPEQAKRLVEAFQQSKERLLEKRMTDISRLLDQTKLTAASGKQNEVLTELDALLRILLEQARDWDRVNDEIDRLEKMRQQVRELLEKQRDHLHETDRLANRDKTLADMDRQIQQLEELIARQEDVYDQTKQSTPEDLDTVRELAEEQDALQQDTEQLAQEVAGQREGQAAGDGQGSPPSDSKEDNPSGSPSNAGAPSLSQAAQHQQAAAKKLAQSLPRDAQQDEQKALEDLKKALQQLRRERDRIARLPQKMLDQLAQKQDATAEETQKLSQQMQQAPDEPSQSQGGQEGKKNVQNAQQAMKQASSGLRDADPSSAARDQEKAVEELKKALDEIEQRLAQLREETLIDRLARLEARFREMLARQRKITESTASIQQHRNAQGKLRRADRLKLKKLASDERDLAEQAYQTLDILVEDGTSVVFPRVVSSLREDLESVGALLDDQRTGDYTQALQQEIELTLQELIDALQRNLKKKKGGGSGQCDCEPPLLPGSAELKLLRSMQLRVNRRTVHFDKTRPHGALDDVLRKEISQITSLQEEVAEMALELAEKY